jgi:hypothetical protein
MLTSTSTRSRALIASLTVALLGVLALPGTAPASTATCNGHTEKAEAETAGDHALAYAFGCSEKILGYSVIFNQEIQSFEAEVPVLDAQGTATNELMSCEGDIPSFGIGCFGGYSAGGRQIKGKVDIDRDACAEPRYTAFLMVVTGSKGQSAGPFPLGRPQGCRPSSQLKGLLAWISMLRADIRAAAKAK